MFNRLKRPEEERDVEVNNAIAMEADPTNLSGLFKTLPKIPEFLKRVNKENGVSMILVKILNAQSSDKIFNEIEDLNKFTLGEIIKKNGTENEDLTQNNKITDSNNECKLDKRCKIVKVPKYAPSTAEQYDVAKKIWPCYYFHKIEEQIDQEIANEMIQKVLHDVSINSEICSGGCIIADGGNILAVNEDKDDVLGHSIMQTVTKVSKLQLGYLCTGYSAYLYQEPCLSCAMALVHGRIKNVFCYRKRLNGPFSSLKFNYCKSLNHRYNVYFYDKN